MPTKPELLDAAIEVLRQGQALTIDAVARQSELTKPGVVHHFATKEALTIAVVDRVLDQWEKELSSRVDEAADLPTKLRAYVDYALTGDLDAADLAVMIDPRLRDKLAARWAERMDPWFGGSDDPPPALAAARLIADGAWIDRSLGMLDLPPAKRAEIVGVAVSLIDEGLQK